MTRPRAAGAAFAVALALAASAALAPAAARAGPPYATDDPDPVELHHWEVYLAGTATHDEGGWSGSAPQVEVNYGAAPGLQLHAILPLAFSAPPGGSVRFGPGDVELGMKLRLVEERPEGPVPMVGTFPLVEIPSGDANAGLGTGGTRVFVPLWLQKSFGPWLAYGGGGYWFDHGPGRRNSWFTGAHLERRVVERLSVGAEVYHQSADEIGGAGETRADLGAVLDLSDVHHLMASAGSRLGTPSFQAYVAYQATFGR